MDEAEGLVLAALGLVDIEITPSLENLTIMESGCPNN